MRTYKIYGLNTSYSNFNFEKYIQFLKETDYEAEAKALELLAQYHKPSVSDLAWQFMYNGDFPTIDE